MPQKTEWPLLEFPFNTHTGYAWPSYQQSLLLSSNYYLTAHTLFQRHMEAKEIEGRYQRLAILGFDILSIYLPLGSAWLHEEWHRGVMTQRQIGSQNDVYKMGLFQSVIAVSHVDDADLVRLKRDFPAEQVRLSSAGMEAQIEQNLYLEKEQFFDNSKAWNQGILWINSTNVWFYIYSCNQGTSTDQTKDQESSDGSDMSKRDFTGLDCLGWVYDLFRPDEPYSARGVHPSGVGIDRYRTLEDLNSEEKEFLNKQQYLALFNFLDPFLFRKTFFQAELWGQEVQWNLKSQHFLTSFGYAVDLVGFLKNQEEKFLVKLHSFFNNKRYFPGLRIEILQRPFRDLLLWTLGISVWEQPLDQRVNTTQGFWGGSLDIQVDFPLGESWRPFVYVAAKERGWQAGRVELGRGFLLGTGLSLQF